MVAVPDTEAGEHDGQDERKRTSLIKQFWDFLEDQLEISEKREMKVGTFVTSANEMTILGFWRKHATGEIGTRRAYEIFRLLSPCWESMYMHKRFYAGKTIFEAFVQDLSSISINLLLALYLVNPSYLFNMGPA